MVLLCVHTVASDGVDLRGLSHNSGLFQKVDRHLCTGDHSPVGESHVEVFAESRGIVVDSGAGVAKSLNDGTDDQNLFLQISIWGLNKDG